MLRVLSVLCLVVVVVLLSLVVDVDASFFGNWKSNFRSSIFFDSRRRRKKNNKCLQSSSSSLLLVSPKKEEEDHDDDDVMVIKGALTKESLAQSQCWGIRPLLMREAFSDSDDAWPTWEEVALLSCDDEAESRFITHKPGKDTSWELQLGPLEEVDVRNRMLRNNQQEQSNNNHHHHQNNNNDMVSSEKWTLVVNDVDRFYPSLADWIHDHFHFIPRWRRDDGQISLAPSGGGIGPHVDNYDVFLIQMQGTREWQIGKTTMDETQEREESVPDLDVRILSTWSNHHIPSGNVQTLVLQPGDVLYLPPRIPHCGTAITDHCMTLSVGMRAPSASEIISRIAEQCSNAIDGDATKRYQDNHLFTANNNNNRTDTVVQDKIQIDSEISEEVKTQTKQLVHNAIQSILQDDDAFDRFIGSLLTESKRQRINYPTPLITKQSFNHDDDHQQHSYAVDDDNDDMDHHQDWLESLGVWGDPQSALDTILSGQGALYSAEGISWAYSSQTKYTTVNNDTVKPYLLHRLFANGEVWEIEQNNKTTTTQTDTTNQSHSPLHTIQTIANHRRITRNHLIIDNDDNNIIDGNNQLSTTKSLLSEDESNLLKSLIAKGYLYGEDD